MITSTARPVDAHPSSPPWRVVHALPGRVRLRHVGLQRRSAAVQRLEERLLSHAGVRSVRVNARTGSLLLEYDPQRRTAREMVLLVQSLSHELSAAPAAPPAPNFALANVTLATALAADHVLLALTPVSALLLVTSQANHLAAACKQIRAGKLGMPVLYSAIVGTTLATGGFTTSALMGWMFCYWERNYQRNSRQARRELFATLAQQAQPLPTSTADQHTARHSGHLHRAIDEAHHHHATQGRALAERTVLPVLTTAGVGLLTGDLTTMAATLRPDYATGLTKAPALQFVHDARRCLEAGVLLREADTLRRIAAAKAILVAPAAAERLARDPQAAEQLTEFMATQRVPVLLAADLHDARSAELAVRLRLRLFDRARMPQLRHTPCVLLTSRGDLGDTSPAAQVRLNLGDDTRPAAATLLHDSPAPLAALWEIAGEHRQRAGKGLARVAAANLACVAGAFGLGFTNLHTVLITNLGTWGAFRAAKARQHRPLTVKPSQRTSLLPLTRGPHRPSLQPNARALSLLAEQGTPR